MEKLERFAIWFCCIMFCLGVWVIIVLIFTKPAHSEVLSEKQAIHCLMGEARSEGEYGMILVGEVLRRRGSTRGMYGCDAKFNEPKWVHDMAKRAWRKSKYTNYSRGATHFESTDFPKPYWAKDMIETRRYKKQIFYKER